MVIVVTTTDISTDSKIEVPRGTYSLQYSPRLVRTINHLPDDYTTAESNRADFYDALKVAAVMAVSLPTAGEEQAIYVQRSAGAKKLRDVEEFRDHFANNDERVYIWGHSLTGLRFRETDVRKPYNVGDKITAQVIETDISSYLSQIADPKFTRENWKDIIDNVNHVKGEVAVPYARGHVIREMHPTLGIFTEVESTTEHKAPYALHGWLRENLDIPQDPISGHYEVAVVRRSDWRHDEDGRCLGVDANYGRFDANSDVGFRPVVRGSGPKIEVVSIDVEKVRREIEGKVRAEVATDLASLKALLEKYRV